MTDLIHVPKPDVLRAGIAHIAADLESWDQDAWVNFCGTAGCLAAHILLADGFEWRHIQVMSVEHAALKLLGFEADKDGWRDADDDANAFSREIFWITIRAMNQGSREADFAWFKAYITKLTGITFEEESK